MGKRAAVNVNNVMEVWLGHMYVIKQSKSKQIRSYVNRGLMTKLRELKDDELISNRNSFTKQYQPEMV